nr:reverse transcriptase domain-containing protein [Tanacetum cinerariifolium]
SGTLPSNTIANPRSDLKAITTLSGVSYDGPQILPPASFLPKSKSLILTFEPVNSPTIELLISPVSAPRPNQRPSIFYLSRLQDQKLHDKTNDQRENFLLIFKDLNFNINFADALILMPKFGPSIKILLTNKDKLCELPRTPLNEHCLAVLLKKFPEKLGEPGKFQIACDFPEKAECLTLADLGTSINLMPLSKWNKLSLPDLTPTCMTLELADRSISRPVGVAEDTSRYSANYSDMTAKRIDVIDMACEEYSQDVLGFSDVIASGNPTPYYDPIVSTTSLTLTPFGNSDFLLEEVDAFLGLEDDPTSPEVNQSYLDSEGDILLLEAFLNDDPSLPLPNQGNYLPEDLPPHLEYAFLERDNKLPVIIAKDLSVEEKTALITVLKSHKRAIAWKLSDIKGTFQRFIMAIFHDMIEKTIEVFMDDFSVFENSFQSCLSHLERMLKRGNEYILVAIDYLSKWVEVKALPTNDARVVYNFLKNLFARFGTPRAIINDQGTHFCNDQVAKVMQKFGVTRRLATPYHPQTSGQVEVSNRGLKSYKTPIRCTPYKRIYGQACHLLIELEHKAYWALKHANFDLQTAGDHKKVQLNELNELCDQAYENFLIYKEKTKRLHDLKIKDRVFNIDDRVLLFNS